MPAAAAVQRPHRRLVCCFALTAVSVQLLASLRTADGFGTTPAGCSGCSTAGCSLYDSCQLYDAHSTAFVAYGGCALLSTANSAHRIQHIVTTTQCRKCCGEKKAMEFFCRRAREACTKVCRGACRRADIAGQRSICGGDLIAISRANGYAFQVNNPAAAARPSWQLF